MRFIRTVQIALVTMILPLASSNSTAPATASSNEITASDSTRNLLSYEDVTPDKLVESREPIVYTEERVATIPAIPATSPHSQDKHDGKKRVVTKYHNKGFLKRLKQWLTSRRLRGAL